jgi:hypothetical protein
MDTTTVTLTYNDSDVLDERTTVTSQLLAIDLQWVTIGYGDLGDGTSLVNIADVARIEFA